MDWSAPTLWWIAAGTLVALELATGTFYLLMLAAGCAAGALAAHAGMGSTAQVVTAALLCGGATVAWHLKRHLDPKSAPVESNPDAILDIGQRVHVAAWQPDGTARVQYRGANWAVRCAHGDAVTTGQHVIVSVHGNELHVAPASTT